MKPRISIIIPTFNRPEKLKRSLRSALSQSIQPDEIIVIDNGENPRTESSIKEVEENFSGPTIHYLRSKLFDIRQALATSIKAATGEWIILLDDDDYLVPDRIQNDIQQIEKVSEEVILLLQDFVRVDYTGKLIWEHLMQHKQMGLYQALTLDSFPPPPAGTWRASVIKERHSYDQANGGTDFDLYASCLPFGKIHKTGRIGYVMDDTRHCTRLTTSADHMLEMVDLHRIRFKESREYLKSDDLKSTVDKRLDQQQAFFAAKLLGAHAFFDSNNSSICRQNLKETLKGIIAPLRKTFSSLLGGMLPEMRGSKSYSLKQFGQRHPGLSRLIKTSKLTEE